MELEISQLFSEIRQALDLCDRLLPKQKLEAEPTDEIKTIKMLQRRLAMMLQRNQLLEALKEERRAMRDPEEEQQCRSDDFLSQAIRRVHAEKARTPKRFYDVSPEQEHRSTLLQVQAKQAHVRIQLRLASHPGAQDISNARERAQSQYELNLRDYERVFPFSMMVKERKGQSNTHLFDAVQNFAPPASHFEPYTSFVLVICGLFALADIVLGGKLKEEGEGEGSPPSLPWDVMGGVIGMLFTPRCVRPQEDWVRLRPDALPTMLTMEEWHSLWFPVGQQGSDSVAVHDSGALSTVLFPQFSSDAAVSLTQEMLDNLEGTPEYRLIRVKVTPQRDEVEQGQPRNYPILKPAPAHDAADMETHGTLALPHIQQCRYIVDLSDIQLTVTDVTALALGGTSLSHVDGLVLGESLCGVGETLPDSFLGRMSRMRCVMVGGKNSSRTVGSKLTAVGTDCFTMCTSLQTVELTFLRHVTRIGGSFLSNCTSLRSVCLKPLSQVTEIAGGFLQGCTDLHTLSLQGLERVTRLVAFTHHAFLGYCTSLETVDLAPLSNVTQLQCAFLSGCKSLRTLCLAPLSKVREIPNRFLGDCQALDSESLLEGLANVTRIQENFLRNCVALQAVDLTPLGTNLQRIGESFLSGCKSLRHVCLTPLGANLYSIPNSFLAGCTQLESVDFRGLDKVVKIGRGFLAGCTRLGRMVGETDAHEIHAVDLTPLRRVTTVETAIEDAAMRCGDEQQVFRVAADRVFLIEALEERGFVLDIVQPLPPQTAASTASSAIHQLDVIESMQWQIDALQKENFRIKTENAQIRKENAEMKAHAAAALVAVDPEEQREQRQQYNGGEYRGCGGDRGRGRADGGYRGRGYYNSYYNNEQQWQHDPSNNRGQGRGGGDYQQGHQSHSNNRGRGGERGRGRGGDWRNDEGFSMHRGGERGWGRGAMPPTDDGSRGRGGFPRGGAPQPQGGDPGRVDRYQPVAGSAPPNASSNTMSRGRGSGGDRGRGGAPAAEQEGHQQPDGRRPHDEQQHHQRAEHTPRGGYGRNGHHQSHPQYHHHQSHHHPVRQDRSQKFQRHHYQSDY